MKTKEKEILRLLEANWTARNIAGYLQTSKNTIYRIRRKNKLDNGYDRSRDFFYEINYGKNL